MIGTRESLEASVKEARYCGQGDLYREGDRYFFSIAGDTNSPRIWRDFWYTVQNMDDEWGNDDTKGDPEEALDWLEGKLTERGV